MSGCLKRAMPVLLSALDRAAVSQRIAFAPLLATRGDHFAVSVPGFLRPASVRGGR
jgi:hypothetical protein